MNQLECEIWHVFPKKGGVQINRVYKLLEILWSKPDIIKNALFTRYIIITGKGNLITKRNFSHTLQRGILHLQKFPAIW